MFENEQKHVCIYTREYLYVSFIYTHHMYTNLTFAILCQKLSPSLSTGLEQLEAPGLTTPVNGNRVPGNVAFAGLTGRPAGLLLPLKGPFPGRRAAVGSAKPGMAATKFWSVKIQNEIAVARNMEILVGYEFIYLVHCASLSLLLSS